MGERAPHWVQRARSLVKGGSVKLVFTPPPGHYARMGPAVTEARLLLYKEP